MPAFVFSDSIEVSSVVFLDFNVFNSVVIVPVGLLRSLAFCNASSFLSISFSRVDDSFPN
jgi:hypothetical protein